MNMILQAIKALFRKTDKQIDEVSKRVEETKKNIPKKLSALENDLFYNKAEPIITLTKDDFVPRYFTDDDGNPTGQFDSFYYKGTPQLDWFTSPDTIGFVIQFTDGDEQATINHHVPGVTTEWSDNQWTESGYDDEENLLYPWFYCDDCGIAIQNGMSISSGEPEPEDCFFIQTDWHDGESVGFDSITIYKVDSKKLPKEVLDTEDFENRINEGMDELWNFIDNAYGRANEAYDLANTAKTNAATAQSTADTAKTAANNALTLNESAISIPKGFRGNGLPTSIVYAAGTFICGRGSADAYYGEKNLLRSSNGFSWTGISYPNTIRDLVYGDGVWLMVSAGYIYYSTDNGVTWNGASAPVGYNGGRVVGYGNGMFVTLGCDSTNNKAAYSVDGGKSWQAAQALPVSTTWCSVAYGKGVYVAVGGGESSNSYILNSTDGITWALAETVSEGAGLFWSVIFNGERFVVVGKNEMWSDDGITWHNASSPTGVSNTSVAYGNGRFVAISEKDYKHVCVSDDGDVWVVETLTQPLSTNLESVGYGDGKFIIPAYDKVYVSVDGVHWTNMRRWVSQNGVDITDKIKNAIDLI